MSKNDLYYLRTILGRLRELRGVAVSREGPTLGSEALNDEIDWLDCFIDKHERKRRA